MDSGNYRAKQHSIKNVNKHKTLAAVYLGEK